MLIIKKEDLIILKEKGVFASGPGMEQGGKWFTVLELLLLFIEKEVLKDGQIIKLSTRNPLHWFKLTALGAEVLKLLIKIIKKL